MSYFIQQLFHHQSSDTWGALIWLWSMFYGCRIPDEICHSSFEFCAHWTGTIANRAWRFRHKMWDKSWAKLWILSQTSMWIIFTQFPWFYSKPSEHSSQLVEKPKNLFLSNQPLTVAQDQVKDSGIPSFQWNIAWKEKMCKPWLVVQRMIQLLYAQPITFNEQQQLPLNRPGLLSMEAHTGQITPLLCNWLGVF